MSTSTNQTNPAQKPKIANFCAGKIAVAIKAIDAFSTGGHPMPTAENIAKFAPAFVAKMAKKALKNMDKIGVILYSKEYFFLEEITAIN